MPYGSEVLSRALMDRIVLRRQVYHALERLRSAIQPPNPRPQSAKKIVRSYVVRCDIEYVPQLQYGTHGVARVELRGLREAGSNVRILLDPQAQIERIHGPAGQLDPDSFVARLHRRVEIQVPKLCPS